MTEPRIYRASSLGYSLCQLVAPHLGYEAIPPPEWLQEKFDEGKEIEPKVLADLENKGWKISASQATINDIGDYQHEFYLDIIPGQAVVRGHIDAFGQSHIYDDLVVEVKSTNDKYFKEIEEKGWNAGGLLDKYKWQISCYMLATGRPVALVWCRKSDEQLYVMYADEPFYSISDIALKIASAEEHIREGKIPDGCTDFPCPYFYLHGGADNIPPEPADKDMDTLLTAWLEANKRKKIYEGEEKALREMIVEMAGAEISGKIKGSQGVVVSTVYQEESEYVTKRKAGWITRVSAPRKRKDVAE